jgi:general secretion pathway protein M
MKEWWLNLTPREQQLLSIGSVILVIALFYLFIWQPLVSSIDDLNDTIAGQQQLLAWMNSTTPQLIEARNMSKPIAQIDANLLLSTIDQSLKAKPISDKPPEINQTESNKVQVKFVTVGFDNLIAWLNDLWQNNDILVSQATITSSKSTGEVQASLILESNAT